MPCCNVMSFSARIALSALVLHGAVGALLHSACSCNVVYVIAASDRELGKLVSCSCASLGSMAVDPRYTPDLVAGVQALLKHAHATGQKTSSYEKILKLMSDAGLAYKQQIPPEFVGVHPDNRSGMMVSPVEAHSHGADILGTGWSDIKCSDATALETPPGDTAPAMANVRLATISGGLIPPLADCRMLSVGSSHTNVFLRACKASCTTCVSTLADSNGRLSLDEVGAGKPEFRSAVMNGMTWQVFHWQADSVFPGADGLVSLVQSALNTSAQSGQGEIEVLLELGRMRDAIVKNGGEVEWPTLEAKVKQSLPSCGAWVNQLGAYCRQQAPELLRELDSFAKSFVKVRGARACGSEFWAKLNSIMGKWGQAEKLHTCAWPWLKPTIRHPQTK